MDKNQYLDLKISDQVSFSEVLQFHEKTFNVIEINDITKNIQYIDFYAPEPTIEHKTIESRIITLQHYRLEHDHSFISRCEYYEKYYDSEDVLMVYTKVIHGKVALIDKIDNGEYDTVESFPITLDRLIKH